MENSNLTGFLERAGSELSLFGWTLTNGRGWNSGALNSVQTVDFC